jgi:hypothetical protein
METLKLEQGHKVWWWGRLVEDRCECGTPLPFDVCAYCGKEKKVGGPSKERLSGAPGPRISPVMRSRRRLETDKDNRRLG